VKSKFLSPLISSISGKDTISVPGMICSTIWGSFAVHFGDHLQSWAGLFKPDYANPELARILISILQLFGEVFCYNVCPSVLRYQCTPNDHHSLAPLYSGTFDANPSKVQCSSDICKLHIRILYEHILRIRLS